MAALVNIWHLRKVAEASAKPCDICYKPTTGVLITPDNKASQLWSQHFLGSSSPRIISMSVRVISRTKDSLRPPLMKPRLPLKGRRKSWIGKLRSSRSNMKRSWRRRRNPKISKTRKIRKRRTRERMMIKRARMRMKKQRKRRMPEYASVVKRKGFIMLTRSQDQGSRWQETNSSCGWHTTHLHSPEVWLHYMIPRPRSILRD